MKRFLQFSFICLTALTMGSCNFAPDMEWVPLVNVEEKKNGEVVEKYDNGKTKTIIHFKNNRRHGLATNFYENGNKNMEIEYVRDMKHGPFKWYYETGELYQEGSYRNDKLDGQVIEYSKNGAVKSMKNYSMGYEMSGSSSY